MHREHHRWFSPTLGRDMDLLLFGHGGAKVVVFPTSKGRYFEWEDRGMMWSLREHLDRGWLQICCVDSVDAESWYAYHLHPGARAWRHELYDRYVVNEVLATDAVAQPESLRDLDRRELRRLSCAEFRAQASGHRPPRALPERHLRHSRIRARLS